MNDTPDELRELARVNEIENSYLRGCRVPQRTVDATDLVLEQALCNIIPHGLDDTERYEIAAIGAQPARITSTSASELTARSARMGTPSAFSPNPRNDGLTRSSSALHAAWGIAL